MDKEKEISFEEALNKLKEAVEALESGQIKLDEAFAKFEDGIKYARICEEKLTNVENKVAFIVNDGKIEEFKED